MVPKRFNGDSRIFVPNNPVSPRLCPELAAEIGLNESILLLQIEYWIVTNGQERDGRVWTYRSLADIRDTFPFWSRATVARIVQSLKEQGLIDLGNYNQHEYDRTYWYTISIDACRKLRSVQVAPLVGVSQNETAEVEGVSHIETASHGELSQTETAKAVAVSKWDDDTRDKDREQVEERVRGGERYPNPAIVAFREIAHYCPPPGSPMWEAISKLPADAAAMQKWRDVIREWMLRGFRTRNIAGMLEWYESGIPPRGTRTGKVDQRARPGLSSDPAFRAAVEATEARWMAEHGE